jgi:hypothetical protein
LGRETTVFALRLGISVEPCRRAEACCVCRYAAIVMARNLVLLELDESWLFFGSRMRVVMLFVVGGSCAAVERCTGVDGSF